MNTALSQQLEKLLGRVPVSNLSPVETSGGSLIVYRMASAQSTEMTHVYKTQLNGLVKYFCANAYAFLVKETNGKLSLDIGSFLNGVKTPIELGRKLCTNTTSKNWIGLPKSASNDKNLTDVWFKHFQYHYFDNFNKWQNTMLLKYADAMVDRKTFDILIWLDSSSMVNQIDDIADGISELCNVIFSQNPNNRVSVVQFQHGGYTNNAQSTLSNDGKRKGCSHHLPFTNQTTDVSNFIHNLAAWFPNRTGWFDENLWFVGELAKSNFRFYNPTDKSPCWSGEEMPTYWDVGWRTGSDIHKMIFAISDEITDEYISVTGKIATAYVPGYTPNDSMKPVAADRSINMNWVNDTNKVTNSSQFETANWVYTDRSGTNGFDTTKGTGSCDPYVPLTGGEGTANSGGLTSVGYSYASNGTTLAKWRDNFKNNKVQLHFIAAGGQKNILDKYNDLNDIDTYPNIKKYFEPQRQYIYLFQRDLLDNCLNLDSNGNPLPNDEKLGFLYCINQTDVCETMRYIFQNVVLMDDSRKLSNDMWETHLSEVDQLELPSVETLTGDIKTLCIPSTSIKTNNSLILNKEYKRRNYTKIVTGGQDFSNTHDKTWADEQNLPENNDTYVDSNKIHRENIGDIDQTLKSIAEFLDDYEVSLEPVKHTGKVIFTMSKEVRPLGNGWKNVFDKHISDTSLPNDNENHTGAFVWAGGAATNGGNVSTIDSIPQHDHNTLPNNGKIRTISIIGRPEGETVGGIAKTDTAKRLEVDATDASGIIKDSKQTSLDAVAAKLTKVTEDGSVDNDSIYGAYSGYMIYSDSEKNNQQKHNNRPLYCKMRAFCYVGS